MQALTMQKTQLIVPANPAGGIKFPKQGLVEPLILPKKRVSQPSVYSTKNIHALDKGKLKSTIENSFGKKLVPGFFEKNDIKEVFVVPAGGIYLGAGIIKTVLETMPYLDKLAVLGTLKGMGIGKTLLGEIMKKYPKLILRASPENEAANKLYSSFFQWAERKGAWNIYFSNLSFHEIEPAMDAVAEKGKTLL